MSVEPAPPDAQLLDKIKRPPENLRVVPETLRQSDPPR